MKCRVCGYEFNGSTSYCPMCGTKADMAEKPREATAIDMAWNTKDFPKPKKMEDIEMNWGEQPTFMKTDGSEGSFLVENEPVRIAEKKTPGDFEIPSFMAQPRKQPALQADYRQEAAQRTAKQADYASILPNREDGFAAWTMPARQAEPDYQYYNISQSQLQPAPSPTYSPSSARLDNPTYIRQTYTPSPTPALTPEEREFWYGKEYNTQVPQPAYQAPVQPQQTYQAPVQTVQYQPQPAYQQPVYQAPAQQATYQAPLQPQPVQQPVYQAAAQQTTYQAPLQPQPAYQQPVYQAPAQQTAYQAPLQPQPAYQQPVYQAPAQQQTYQEPVQPQPEPVQQPAQPVQQAVQPVQQPVQPKAFEYENAYPNYDNVTTQAQKQPEQFYTFQAKTEEFQRLLDEQYERINALYGQDYSVISQDTNPGAAAVSEFEKVQAQDVSAFEKSLFGDDSKPAAQENLPKQETKPEDIIPETLKPVEKPGEIFFNERDYSELNLDELISDPLDPRFNIDTLEMTIKELKKQDERETEKCSERRKKLAAMEAAREAYFRSLDEEAGITRAQDINPKSKMPDNLFSPEKKAEEVSKEEIKPAEIAEEKATPTEEKKTEKAVPEEKTETAEVKETEDADAKTDAESEKPEALPEEVKPEKAELHPDLKGLYSDDEDAENEVAEKKKGGFFKFLGVLILIVVILELAILALKNFMPEADITATATQIETAVIDALTAAYNKVAEFFTNTYNSLFNK